MLEVQANVSGAHCVCKQQETRPLIYWSEQLRSPNHKSRNLKDCSLYSQKIYKSGTDLNAGMFHNVLS